MVIDKMKLKELKRDDVAEGSKCMGFNLKKTTRAVQNLFDNAYKSVGLEGTQYTVLSHVFVAGPITLSKLADLMYVDRTTLGRNLKPLDKKGLIEIKSGKDRRAKLISITDHGKEVLSQALPIWKETHEQIKNLLGLENWSSTVTNLQTLTLKLKEQ